MLKQHADNAAMFAPAKQSARNPWRLQLQGALLEPAEADMLSPGSQFFWQLSGAPARAPTRPPADKHEGGDDREQWLADAGAKVRRTWPCPAPARPVDRRRWTEALWRNVVTCWLLKERVQCKKGYIQAHSPRGCLATASKQPALPQGRLWLALPS